MNDTENSEVEAQKKELEDLIDQAKGLVKELNAAQLIAPDIINQKEPVEVAAQSVIDSKQQVDESTKDINNRLKELNDQEKHVKELQSASNKLMEKIAKLLPPATGAGLSESFRNRKDSLQTKMKWYVAGFILSIIGFLLFGIFAFSISNIESVKDFIKFTVERSPIVAGLVLLEEFSRRLFVQASKLEEDYAYKETISISFDGYRKVMKDAGGYTDTPTTASEVLVKNTLDALGERPGRLTESDTQKNEPAEAIFKDLMKMSKIEVEGNVVPKLFGKYSNLASLVSVKNILMLLIAVAVGVAVGMYIK